MGLAAGAALAAFATTDRGKKVARDLSRRAAELRKRLASRTRKVRKDSDKALYV